MKALSLLVLAALCFATLAALHAEGAEAKKPLKVFILVGQSNMQGHAAVRTFAGIAMDPKTKPMYDEMCDADGKPRVLDDVRISYLTETGDWNNPTPQEISGPLAVGFGALGRETKIGPEYTFGIYMHKYLNEPILLIKTAWGGRSLNTDFRPPSAGPYVWNDEAKNLTEEKKQQKIKATGVYYRKMIEHVKKILADPAKVYPAYDKAAGYEIAGFLWFQGFNDLVDGNTYPNGQPGRFDAYGVVLAQFIRDVRKDLDAPQMPFIIGVMGIDGIITPETEAAKPERARGVMAGFRAAMAKPATMPEFKGSVVAIETAPFWDAEIDRIEKIRAKAVAKAKQDAKTEKLDPKQSAALEAKYVKETLTPKDAEYLEKNASNQGYHYYGSAKTLGGVGKAFADAIIELRKKNG